MSKRHNRPSDMLGLGIMANESINGTTEKPPKSRALESAVALTTSLIAVALALSTIFSNAMGDELLITRGQANSTWSYFQSKSIKQNLFEVQRDNLKLQTENPDINPIYKTKILAQVANFDAEIIRYEKEKKDIQKKAKNFEIQSEKADLIGARLDLAEAFYQIAIILSAISIIARSTRIWYVSITLGSIGIFISFYAYFLSL